MLLRRTTCAYSTSNLPDDCDPSLCAGRKARLVVTPRSVFQNARSRPRPTGPVRRLSCFNLLAQLEVSSAFFQTPSIKRRQHFVERTTFRQPESAPQTLCDVLTGFVGRM